MIKRIKETWQNILNMTQETALTVKQFLFGLIIVDIFGIWWFFGLKKLGSSLMIVILICLAIILFIENRFEKIETKREVKPEMTIKCNECKQEFRTQKELAQHIMAKHFKKKKTDLQKVADPQEIEENTEESDVFGFGSLPSPEEYQKRTEEALGGELRF